MAAPAAKSGECVKVVIRCRPMSSQEENDNREKIVELDVKEGVARVRRPGTSDSKDFTFDAVYDANTVQSNFYDQTGYPVVESVLDGYNGTIFAYGQTGTGKTHTMVGRPDDLQGVIPRTFGHIFNTINMTPNRKFLVRASYLEIYNEEIRDLLSKNPKQKLELKDHPDGGVFVKDLSNLIVKGVDDLTQVMEVGQKNRSVASTLMNNESSRSHSIFTITVETAETGVDNKDHIRVGKMNMVDLAGSERQSKTGASGDTLKEATKINMSLSALGNVISALVDAKTSFIPYRDSKLTRLLQDSLGGNTKTVMCACIGPVDYNYDETLSTLRYAYRAKSIKNKPKINEDPKDAMIREFQDEIARLKTKLAEKGPGGGPARMPRAPVQPGQQQTPQEQEVIVETEVREVERVVEKEVLVEKVVNVGITDADMANIQANVEQERAQVEAQLMAEQQAIEAQINMAEEEKQRLLADIEERRQKRAEEQEAHEHMLQQLKQMEEKMLVGSQVMETAMRQENELRKAEIEVDERKREEQRMKEELEAAAEEKLNLEEKYASTEEQVQKLTAKLEKLWNRHKQTQQETQDLQQEFQLEREDMLETIRDLRKEVKLVCLTIDSFIPMEQYQQIVERAHYDDSTDEWVITNIDLAGNRVRPARKRILDDGHSGDSPRALLRGPDSSQQGDPGSGFAEERPNVYFAYTEDGGAARAETRPAPSPQKTSKNQRMKSAGRPNTANRKGRAVKTGAAGASATSMNNFLHSPDPEEDDGLHAYPKARGLVKAAS
mmetsp:Transcript_175257/g.562097  ORF Transcript_175257/g.562097 Transcript_175257/m.562097 type:complete len:779 (-) Transcript_175257:52-2388(-)